MVSYLRIPTYCNATELSEFIMERRRGARSIYTANTDPTIFEVNERLLAAEGTVAKMINSQWRPDENTEEHIWYSYRHGSYTGYRYRRTFYRAINPATLTLLFHPIISIEKIEVIVGETFVDLIASEEYTEGWDGSYYIDYRNGVIEFRRFKPKFRTPIKLSYTHGRTEDVDGYVVAEGSANADATTELEFTSVASPSENSQGRYAGKLIKFTSGALAGETYRVKDTSYSSGVTTFVLMNATLFSDALLEDDEYDVYAIPKDVQEMVKIYTYLGMLISDPTYQHNFVNPFEELNPQWNQFEWLQGRFMQLVDQRKNTVQLLN